MSDLPSIIGRDRFVVDKAVKLLYQAARRAYDHSDIHEERRGSWFDLKLTDDGHEARVTVELLPRRDPPCPVCGDVAAGHTCCPDGVS